MMSIVHRKDITSIRDLKKKDVPWLREIAKKMTLAICTTYPELEEDQIKLYVHCT